MPSIYKLNRKGKSESPYWYAKYKKADGLYAYKSTGLTNKREAQRLANEWEQHVLAILGARLLLRGSGTSLSISCGSGASLAIRWREAQVGEGVL